MEALSTEIRRIVNCPYVPTLQPLCDILKSDHCPKVAWGQANSCLIGPLTEAVLGEMGSQPSHALEILNHLSSIPFFRNSVLEQNPLLLDALLRKAIESDSSYEKYARTCLALLQKPLEIAMPASLPSFLLFVSDKAVQNPSHKTISDLYWAFSSMTFRDTSLVPPATLLRLQDSLVTVLKTSDVEDVSMSLFSLALLAKFSSGQGPCVGFESSDSALVGQILTNSYAMVPGRRFFSAAKASKTLDLVVLKAILLCSRKCTLSSTRVSESLNLCIKTAEAIPRSEISSWNEENSVKVKKLCEKIVRPDISRDVQDTALLLMLLLTDEKSLPMEIVTTIKKLLCDLHCPSVDSKDIARCLDLLDDEGLTRLFYVLLEQTWKPMNLNIELCKLCNAAIIAQCFIGTSERIPKLAPTISRMMATNGGKAMVRSFLEQSDMPLRDMVFETIESCRCAYQEAYRQLHNAIRIILLSSVIICPIEERDDLTSDLISLLNLQRNLRLQSCPARRARAKSPPLSIFNTISMPQTVSASRLWKDSFIKEMSQDAHSRSESIIRMVGEVCRDLELRCEDAERPLRKEQSKVHDLEANLQQCDAKLYNLREEVEGSRLRMHQLRDEKDSLQENLRSCEHRLQGMSCKHDMLQKELDRHRATAQHAADTATESSRLQDLAYLAILTGKDELIEDQASKLAAIAQQNQALEDTNKQLRSQWEAMLEEIQADKETIEDLKKTESKLIDVLNTKEANIERLSNSETSLIANLESVSRQARETASKNDDVIAELTSRMLAAETARVQLRDQYQREMAEQVAASSFLAQQTQAEISKLQNDLLQARGEAAQSVSTKDSTILGLERKISIFQQERQARAREFAEAQELSSRLMTIVGKKQTSLFAPANESKSPTQVQIGRKHGRSPTQLAKFNRSPTSERSTCGQNATFSPLPSTDALFTSDSAEKTSISQSSQADRGPLTPHLRYLHPTETQ